MQRVPEITVSELSEETETNLETGLPAETVLSAAE